ncbi:MAG: cobalt-precorrin-6A reductase [Sulfitobacter sp.]
MATPPFDPKILILAGTTEATALAHVVASAGLRATVSFAGRVERPKRQPLPQRIGGFGGVDGLVWYLGRHNITHVVDATHPFAAGMSRNAGVACAQANVPLIALTRAPWAAQVGDSWNHVPDIAGAVAALNRPACRVMLAVGRMHLEAFTPNPQHFYLLRLVDAPKSALNFPDHHFLVSRGPFTFEDDLALMQRHRIDLVVSKNSGGTGAYAKIAAARQLRLPVVMIDRPDVPARAQANSAADVMAWLDHRRVDRGV